MWYDAFLDELQKIAEADEATPQELIEQLSPRPQGFTEKVLPVGAVMGGTMGGSALARSLGAAPGWKGKALAGIGGVAGGLAGLGAGASTRNALIRNRRIDAYKKLTGQE